MTETTATTTDASEALSDLYRYLILDRTDPEQCVWVLAIPGTSFPALLDKHGRPERGELARAMNTARKFLGYAIYLQSVFGAGGMAHRIMAPAAVGETQDQRAEDRPAGDAAVAA